MEEDKINIKENFKTYWGFIKKYKLLFFGVLVFVFLSEIKQIADKYLIKIIFDKSEEFISGTISVDLLGKIVMILLGTFLLLTLFINVFGNWMREHLIIKLDTRIIYDLKEKYFSHIISLDHRFFTSHKTGSLISRMSRGGSAIERMTDSIFYEFSPLIFQFSALMISLIYLDKTSAIIMTITVISFLTFNLLYQKRANRDRVPANQAEDLEKANIADIFTNIDSIKYFGKEDVIRGKYLELAEDTKKTLTRSYNHWRLVATVNGFIMGVSSIVLLYFSFKSFMRGEMTLGTLSFVYTTFISLGRPLFSFIHGFRSMNRAMVDLQDLFDYGKIESKIKNKSGAGKIKITKGEVEFDSVNFSYDKRKILKDFSLKIPANKKIAFVGHSGSGKTTLVKLLYRLYDINSGEIRVDGVDIRDVKYESLREEMAIVPQECILFDDTIYNNIKFSNPKASKKEIMNAIKFAQLDKIVSRFPQKENTIVGERGVKLSGGEKQRVSIARAILANKKILVLDEATSALDSETENEIQQALKKLMIGRTSIVIAHRLSTIMNSDLIVVMKNGKIVQQGTHNELIKVPGEYKKLWSFQKGGYLKG